MAAVLRRTPCKETVMQWYVWVVIVASQVWLVSCLVFIAYQYVIVARMLAEVTAQNVIVARMLAEVTALVQRTH
jgi:hypothetical protein